MALGVFGPSDCTLKEVIHFRGLWMVLNVFSREGENTFQIKQELCHFPLTYTSEYGLYF